MTPNNPMPRIVCHFGNFAELEQTTSVRHGSTPNSFLLWPFRQEEERGSSVPWKPLEGGGSWPIIPVLSAHPRSSTSAQKSARAARLIGRMSRNVGQAGALGRHPRGGRLSSDGPPAALIARSDEDAAAAGRIGRFPSDRLRKAYSPSPDHMGRPSQGPTCTIGRSGAKFIRAGIRRRRFYIIIFISVSIGSARDNLFPSTGPCSAATPGPATPFRRVTRKDPSRAPARARS